VLEDARRLGFLGPGPVEGHVRHAAHMAAAIGAPAGRFLDLGTGGGIPGLVLAIAWPDAAGALLDSRERRTTFLVDAVTALGLGDRIEVIAARAEEAAHDPAHRGRYTLVVARGFGPPAVTAECAAGFLAPGGRLAVSEPPDTDPTERWPTVGVTQLGFTPPEVERADGVTVAILTLTTPAKAHVPRESGRPTKRPLW
jgi:hypothetical protein